MPHVPFADLSDLHAPIRDELLGQIEAVVDSNAYCLGPFVERFEQSFAEYVGAEHCVGVQSGTSALVAAFAALGIGPGDEVVVPANTFVATVGAVHFVGATPVLVDVDPVSYAATAEHFAAAVTDRTKAFVPVHLYGQMAEMESIQALADDLDVDVVEDASQAHGARLGDRHAGRFGRIGCFSFYPGKNLGALGEAGACVTDDAELALRMRKFRNHGGVERYQHDVPAMNFRMEGLQGAALDVKLPHLDAWNQRRRETAEYYRQGLADLPVQTPRELDGRHHVYHLYVIECDDRDALREFLQGRDVASGIHYPTPIHLMKAYRHLGYEEGDFPVSERAADRIVSLPIWGTISDEQRAWVVDSIRAFFS